MHGLTIKGSVSSVFHNEKVTRLGGVICLQRWTELSAVSTAVKPDIKTTHDTAKEEQMNTKQVRAKY